MLQVHKNDFASEGYYDFAQQLLTRGFEYLDSGAFRHTFMRGGVVIKVPRNDHGITDNQVEADAYRKWKHSPTDRGIYLAPCRLMPNGCLMMVTVDLDYKWKDAPEWIHYIEGGQAGRYKGGYVAYDYAYDV